MIGRRNSVPTVTIVEAFSESRLKLLAYITVKTAGGINASRISIEAGK